jgi:hypothetical protein
LKDSLRPGAYVAYRKPVAVTNISLSDPSISDSIPDAPGTTDFKGNDMPVGDVDSTAKGSAARYNDGKPELAQIPMEMWSDMVARCGGYESGWVTAVLSHWHNYQLSGNSDYLIGALRVIPVERMHLAAEVLTYGATKYKQWNWTKGQAWSIPFNSGLRHVKSWMEQELFDPESGCTHIGHFICNVLFLAYYVDHYPEGEDWVVMEEVTDENS